MADPNFPGDETRTWPRAPALIACSALSGALLFLSFPPVDLGPLAFVAFVPLLLAVGATRTCRGAALCGTAAAAAAYLPAFAWVASVAVPGWLALSLYVGLYLIAAAAIIRLFQRHFPTSWPVLATLLWTGLELFRARLGPGFPWLFLGYTQYRLTPLVQWATLGGVYAVSFLVFFVNAALAAGLRRLAHCPGADSPHPVRAWVTLPVGLLLLCGALAAGNVMRQGVRMRRGPVVGVVQQNFPRRVQEIYGKPRTNEQIDYEIEREIRKASELSVSLRKARPVLIVWPETTVQLPLNLAPSLLANPRLREILEGTLEQFRRIGSATGAALLVGAPSYFPRRAGYVERVRYGTEVKNFANSALLFSPGGLFVERYDKIRLVPFGEYIPLRDALPFLQMFTPIGRELTPGDEAVVFSLASERGPLRFGALICYEDVFPALTRQFRRNGAEVLINLTDEGWYSIPGELGQHLAMAVFRAVETRTAVVRAANTGISCFITPRGEITARLEANREGVLAEAVQLCPSVPFYVRRGDVFGVLCLMLVLALPGLLFAVGRRRAG